MGDWFTHKDEHEVLGGGYSDVSIFLTDKGFSAVRKWCGTDMKGVLRIIRVKELHDYPVALI